MVESLHISSKSRITVYYASPHEAWHILQVADERLAKQHILCVCHKLKWVISIVFDVIKAVEHVKHKARVLLRHTADVVLDDLHRCWLELLALAKAVEDLSEL